MLGYAAHKKGYRLLNLVTKVMFVFRDVKFHESIYPYHLKSYSILSTLPIPSKNSKTSFIQTHQTDDFGLLHKPNHEPELVQDEPDPDPIQPPQPIPPSPLRRSTRTHQPLDWLSDYHTSTHHAANVTCTLITNHHSCFLTQLLPQPEPLHFKQAIKQEN